MRHFLLDEKGGSFSVFEIYVTLVLSKKWVETHCFFFIFRGDIWVLENIWNKDANNWSFLYWIPSCLYRIFVTYVSPHSLNIILGFFFFIHCLLYCWNYSTISYTAFFHWNDTGKSIGSTYVEELLPITENGGTNTVILCISSEYSVGY